MLKPNCDDLTLRSGAKYLHRPLAEAPTVPCPCGQSTRMVTRADTPAANMHITTIRDSRRHHHQHCMEIYHVLEGRATLEIADDTVEIAPGDTIVIPPNVAHRAFGEVEVLIVGIPALDPDDEHFDEPVSHEQEGE